MRQTAIETMGKQIQTYFSIRALNLRFFDFCICSLLVSLEVFLLAKDLIIAYELLHVRCETDVGIPIVGRLVNIASR